MNGEGLTPAQEDYFRILETLHPDRDLRLSIKHAKETLRRRSQRGEWVSATSGG